MDGYLMPVLKPGDRVVVCGAGPAGLTAAYLLASEGYHVSVLESDDQVGGLSRTVRYKGYRFDIGGHRFFTKIPEVQALWEELLTDQLLDVPRLSRIHYQGKYFQYPLRALDALSGLGLTESLLVVLSYLHSRLRPEPVEDNFEQWVTNRFGSRLYRIFFKTYTEKVWGIPCTEIRSEWAAQRIQNLSLARAIISATSPNRRSTAIKTLIHSFKYPRLGPGQMWELCRDRIVDRGGQVLLNHRVRRLDLAEGRVRGVWAETGSETAYFAADHVISTMPLRSLVRAAGDVAPANVRHAAESLTYRDFLLVALILDQQDLFPDNWIYIHTPGVRVGRVQNYNNWSADLVAEPGRTCLGMEYFCFKGDGMWESSDEELLALATRELGELGLAPGAQVVDGAVVRVPKAYPIYDLDYDSHLKPIREFLDGIPNLHTVGRNGMHKYNNQDHSMYTAMLTVENLHGANHDVWAVNTDFDYHEEQRVPQRPVRPVGRGDQGRAMVPPDACDGQAKQFAEILLAAQSAQRSPPVGAERRTTETVLLPLTRELERHGLEFEEVRSGPWQVSSEPRQSPGRNRDLVIPTIARGHFRLRISDHREAARLAGFLSWCNVPEPRRSVEAFPQHAHV